MCGFASIISWGTPSLLSDQSLLRAMGQQINHRGPDDEQVYVSDQVGIVFKRLSIVDLAQGQQPFVNETRSVYMVINGEIYNHQTLRNLLKDSHVFQGQSDGEVLLHLYEEQGLEMLQHINGMFSILLYDTHQQKVYLVRDRLGIKPLYYVNTPTGLLVSSEMKALWVHPDCPVKVDWQAYWRNNGFGYASKLPTYFQGIEQLPGGSWMEIDLRAQSSTVGHYWQYPQAINEFTKEQHTTDTRSIDEISEAYVELLEDAVKIRLMADVEIGLFLSGGIDSVAVAALASKHQPIHTFSVLSQSTFTNGDAEMAHRAAQHLGLPNHQVLYPHHQLPINAQDWKRILWHCEMPDCNPEHLYKFYLHQYAKQTRPDLKVVLLGQGSDEFNGGYTQDLTNFYATMNGLPQHWDTFLKCMRKLERDNFIRHSEESYLYRDVSLHSSRYLQSFAKGLPTTQHPYHFYWRRSFYSLQQYNLWHEDRTSMASANESRVPFLDHRLVEFTLQIPSKHYETLFWNKQILRQGIAPHLPAMFAQRKKIPFFYGNDVRYSYRMVHHLFTQNNHCLLEEALEGGGDALDKDAVWNAFIGITDDPEYSEMQDLLPMLNLGLLQAMANQAKTQSTYDVNVSEVVNNPLASVSVADWDAQTEKLKTQLAIVRTNVHEHSILGFVEGVFLLHNFHQKGIWNIEINGKVDYYLEEDELGDWISFLKEVDGQKTIAQILEKLDLSMGGIRKSLEEAMEFQVLTVINTEETTSII